MEGISVLPALRGEKLARTRPMFIEHENNAFVRDGDWKLVGRDVARSGGVDPAKWELYNLGEDGTEMNNLVSQDPDRVKKMADEWHAWADRVRVYPKPMEKPKKQGQKGKGGDSAKSEDRGKLYELFLAGDFLAQKETPVSEPGNGGLNFFRRLYLEGAESVKPDGRERGSAGEVRPGRFHR